jgi:hypothetical protein
LNLRSKFSEAQKLAQLRALQTVALADGGMSDPEREFVEALDRTFTQLEVPAGTLPAISPAELASAFPDGVDRATVLAFCVLLALVNGRIRDGQRDCLEAFARSLGSSDELDVFRDIQAGRLKQVSRVLDQRGFGGLLMRSHRKRHPIAWRLRRARERLGLGHADLIRKYRRYGTLPPGTLGREYFEFMVGHGLHFPGEAGSLAEHLVYHDLAHVLGGFETTPEDEILVVAFQAASQAENPFFSLVTPICLFHLGLETSGARVARRQTMEWKPGPFFKELRRGMSCRVDFSSAWDFRAHMGLPLDEARSRLGISPRASTDES